MAKPIQYCKVKYSKKKKKVYIKKKPLRFFSWLYLQRIVKSDGWDVGYEMGKSPE